MIFGIVRQPQCAAGVTVIYISHYLDEVFDLVDRITVLRNGRLVSHPRLSPGHVARTRDR